MDLRTNSAEITRQIKDAIETHALTEGRYPKAPKDDVIESVVSAGHDSELVHEQYHRLLQCGEIYEVDGETVGVV